MVTILSPCWAQPETSTGRSRANLSPAILTAGNAPKIRSRAALRRVTDKAEGETLRRAVDHAVGLLRLSWGFGAVRQRLSGMFTPRQEGYSDAAT